VFASLGGEGFVPDLLSYELARADRARRGLFVGRRVDRLPGFFPLPRAFLGYFGVNLGIEPRGRADR
jgi:hypothetical protein